jgi:hypothetical protein
MQKLSQRLDNFIAQSTRGAPSPIPKGEDMGGDRVWSGAIAEVDERRRQWFFSQTVRFR